MGDMMAGTEKSALRSLAVSMEKFNRILKTTILRVEHVEGKLEKHIAKTSAKDALRSFRLAKDSLANIMPPSILDAASSDAGDFAMRAEAPGMGAASAAQERHEPGDELSNAAQDSARGRLDLQMMFMKDMLASTAPLDQGQSSAVDGVHGGTLVQTDDPASLGCPPSLRQSWRKDGPKAKQAARRKRVRVDLGQDAAAEVPTVQGVTTSATLLEEVDPCGCPSTSDSDIDVRRDASGESKLTVLPVSPPARFSIVKGESQFPVGFMLPSAASGTDAESLEYSPVPSPIGERHLRSSKDSSPKNSLSYRCSMNHSKIRDKSQVDSIMCKLRVVLDGDNFGTPWIIRMFDDANTTTLKESVWDLTLLMFYPPLGLSTNIMVCVCVVVNACLQLVFTYMVLFFISGSNDDLSSLAGDFATWRAATSESLRDLVCEQSAALGTEYHQVNVLSQFDFYTGAVDRGLFSPGPFLCLAVCFAWSLSVLKVVGEILDQVRGVWYLTRRNCPMMEIEADLTGFHIQQIPIHRSAWFYLTCSVQVVIASVLLISGLVWLTSTTDMVEVLLNGIALAYIMELDELTYQVLVPTKISSLIRLMEPFQTKWPRLVPVRSLVLLLPLTSTMVVVATALLAPVVDDVKAVQSVLCSPEAG
uniref:Uncharacterized protein n=1 Tax=Noctiluca scintillans TaxID=2966 RepID=A0A7S1AT40_NOCSC